MGAAVSRTIGTLLYTVQPLPAMQSFCLQPRLAPALAEVVGAIGSIVTAGSAGKLDETDVAALAPVVGKFFSKLPPAELEAVTRELLAGCSCKGPETGGKVTPFLEVMDVIMVGRTLDMWRVLWFALEVNYPDFFSAARANVAAQAAASPSEGSTTSEPAGPAGASS